MTGPSFEPPWSSAAVLGPSFWWPSWTASARKISFIAQLMDDPKVRLRVATMPQADKFQLHIYAALAEQERDFISARTKAA